MAKVNLVRRAEIGQEKRARTRAQLVAAACTLFSTRPSASVTIDDLVHEAGVAKGTFYVHFDDVHALTSAVADELIRTFDDLLQPQRVATSDPLLRIALGCNAFIERALEEPAWGALVARMTQSYSKIGGTAQLRTQGRPARGAEAIAPAGSLRRLGPRGGHRHHSSSDDRDRGGAAFSERPGGRGWRRFGGHRRWKANSGFYPREAHARASGPLRQAVGRSAVNWRATRKARHQGLVLAQLTIMTAVRRL